MQKILAPIEGELKQVNLLLDEFINSVKQEKVKANFQTFFKVRGKYLRPSLLLLSAGAVKSNNYVFDEGLHKLALILELLHSASLVHDDIVDEDYYRRGEKTVNHVFGNKIAVLAGDTLFSYAFAEVTRDYSKAYSVPITNLALDMCKAELHQANIVSSRSDYLKVIEGKTAQFMSVSCELGALYAGGSSEDLKLLADIGMNLGVFYQMVDDMIDIDPNAMKFIELKDIEKSYLITKELMSCLNPSPYKESLLALVDYMMNIYNGKL